MSSGSDRSIVIRNVIIAVVLILGVGALLFFGLGDLRLGKKAGEEGTPVETASGPGEAVPDTRPDGPPSEGPGGTAGVTTPAERRWTERFGNAPEWPERLRAPGDCDSVEEAVEVVCDAIDAESGQEGSCDLLREAAGLLAARPPSVSAELRRHEVVLANTFHMFRVLGRERVRQMRRGLETAPEIREAGALALYRWAVSRSRCDAAEETLRLETLYDYATFLFRTLGGQAYLRRRAPSDEALTCFYALQVVDEAVERGHNPHGIDPRDEIARCRSLLAGRELVFSERYLENLADMARRWETRGAAR